MYAHNSQTFISLLLFSSLRYCILPPKEMEAGKRELTYFEANPPHLKNISI